MPNSVRHPRPWLRAFWNRAYKENITGLSAMVAYNLMLAVFPFALLVLFIFGQVLKIEGVEASVLDDLQRLFPNIEQTHADRRPQPDRGQLDDDRDRRASSARSGSAPPSGARWTPPSAGSTTSSAAAGSSRSASPSRCCGVVLLLHRRQHLPADDREHARLEHRQAAVRALRHQGDRHRSCCSARRSLITFLICCVIYWAVPKGHMPWRAVWPGALFVTVTVGVANWVFPFYLANVSSLSRFGSTLGFILIALVWFYALSLALLAGAVINSPAPRAARHRRDALLGRAARRRRRSRAAAKQELRLRRAQP